MSATSPKAVAREDLRAELYGDLETLGRFQNYPKVVLKETGNKATTGNQDRQEAESSFRPQPQSLEELDLPKNFLANLILKHCFYLDVFKLRELEDRLKIHMAIILELLDYLTKQKYVEVRGADLLRPFLSSLDLANRYTLTEEGKRRAAELLKYDAYVGPAPVNLKDYWEQVGRQSIHLSRFNPKRLQEVFQGLVISPELIEKLGPALVSGQPLLLYGPPGNGKTTIALRMGEIWEDTILVPYALYVEGQVIRIFDMLTHKPVDASATAPEFEDHRWVRCRRPLVIVGGELTLEMMDLGFDFTQKYYEAPIQLKANNGILIVDDLGRQQISPQELLNRWIVPMENRKDYLCLHTGQKFVIPFDQFLVFATNLEPHSGVDEALLRRLRFKVKLTSVNPDQFIEIFQQVCQENGVEFVPEAVHYLLDKHYNHRQRRMDACHPRDLLEYILDYARFYQVSPCLTPKNLDRACSAYFVH